MPLWLPWALPLPQLRPPRPWCALHRLSAFMYVFGRRRARRRSPSPSALQSTAIVADWSCGDSVGALAARRGSALRTNLWLMRARPSHVLSRAFPEHFVPMSPSPLQAAARCAGALRPRHFPPISQPRQLDKRAGHWRLHVLFALLVVTCSLRNVAAASCELPSPLPSASAADRVFTAFDVAGGSGQCQFFSNCYNCPAGASVMV